MNKMPSKVYLAVVAAALLSIWALSTYAQEGRAEGFPDLAIVRIRINIDYDDSAQNLEQLRDLVAFLKPAKAVLVKGETLSGLILRLYGFGPHDGIPQTYQLLQGEILRLNDWQKPESAVSGEILVPRIPRRRGRYLAFGNPYYGVPAVKKHVISSSTGTRLWSVDAIESNEIKATRTGELVTSSSNSREAERVYELLEYLPKRSAEFRKSTSFYDMQIAVTEEDLRTDAGLRFLNSRNVDTAVTAGRMAIEFANGNSDEDEEFSLSGQDLQTISSLLSRPPQRSAHLFILDSGFPTPQAYQFSRREIHKMFDFARKTWKLKAKNRGSSSAAFVDPLNKHSVKISRAIEAFANLDHSTQRIPVVYFPLTKEQNSREILEELFELDFIADKMGESLGDYSPPPDIQKDAAVHAKSVVKLLPNDACAPLINGKCSIQVRTNKAILEGLWTLADAFMARESSRPVYFINESWIVRNDTLKFRAPGVPKGIAVVAAGNNETIVNSDVDGVDFARQCFPAKNILTVLNLRRGSGVQCKSSRVSDDSGTLVNTMAVGFNGKISGDCGTSFAAPRVAWLLALAESYRPYDLDRTRWAPDIQNRLKEARSPTSGLESLIFDLQTYLGLSVAAQPVIP